jgi:plasmid stabilization system protein ParE
MTPSVRELLSDLPGNLSRRASADLIDIARFSLREWGEATAVASTGRLIRWIRDVEAGTVAGHKRHDVQADIPVRFLKEAPWIVAFRPSTRQILRIMHSARDFPRVFGRS